MFENKLTFLKLKYLISKSTPCDETFTKTKVRKLTNTTQL